MVSTQTHGHHATSHGAEAARGPESELIGLLAEFDDQDALLDACEQARNFGYKQFDAYSPFPVHGIDQAMGIRRTMLPFFVLAIAFCGCALGVGMQWYANAAAESPIFPGYDFIISGKPFWSLPANIPVSFEVIVLSSCFATFLGMWFLNGLPRLANPLHRIERFRRATDDRFFLMIEKTDKQFDEEQTQQQMVGWGAMAIEPVQMDLTDHQIPLSIRRIGLILGLLLLIPPALIYRAQHATNTKPRLHFVPDMDWQYRYGSQNVGPLWTIDREPQYFFADRRVMRLPPEGTVARGGLVNDIELFRGIQAGTPIPDPNAPPPEPPPPVEGQTPEEAAAAAAAAAAALEPQWVTEFPAALTIDQAMVERGRDRFNIYCTACHGYAGEGNGLVNERAKELALNSPIQKGATTNATWTTAKSLYDPEVVKQPVGRIFDTITNGRSTMGPYGSQISTRDRWAIVLYVKSLQATRANEPLPPPPADASAAPSETDPPAPSGVDADSATPAGEGN
jgi:mono/diheme cytochrome c family protein